MSRYIYTVIFITRCVWSNESTATKSTNGGYEASTIKKEAFAAYSGICSSCSCRHSRTVFPMSPPRGNSRIPIPPIGIVYADFLHIIAKQQQARCPMGSGLALCAYSAEIR